METIPYLPYPFSLKKKMTKDLDLDLNPFK